MPDDAILFITDTQAGPERPGWSQQTCCRHLMPQIADGVGRLARERGAVLARLLRMLEAPVMTDSSPPGLSSLYPEGMKGEG